MFKVIITDNYDRETVADELVQDNMTKEAAVKLASEKNKQVSKDGPIYFTIVDQDYVLKRGMEDFI